MAYNHKGQHWAALHILRWAPNKTCCCVGCPVNEPTTILNGLYQIHCQVGHLMDSPTKMHIYRKGDIHLAQFFFFFFFSESFCVLLFPCWWRNSWRVRELPRVAERTVWVWQLTRVILRWFFFLYFQLLFTLFTVRPRALSLAEHTVKGLYLLRTV